MESKSVNEYGYYLLRNFPEGASLTTKMVSGPFVGIKNLARLFDSLTLSGFLKRTNEKQEKTPVFTVAIPANFTVTILRMLNKLSLTNLSAKLVLDEAVHDYSLESGASPADLLNAVLAYDRGELSPQVIKEYLDLTIEEMELLTLEYVARFSKYLVVGYDLSTVQQLDILNPIKLGPFESRRKVAGRGSREDFI